MKSFQLKQSGKQKPPDDPGNPTVDFRGEKRSNETHQSTTEPESELARRGPGLASGLAFSGHALMENRNGLLVDLRIAPANLSERLVALDLLEAHVEGAATVAGDRGYDVRNFVEGCRTLRITLHVAQYQRRPQRSTAARRGTTATGSASGPGNESKRSLAGSRQWRIYGRRDSEASRG